MSFHGRSGKCAMCPIRGNITLLLGECFLVYRSIAEIQGDKKEWKRQSDSQLSLASALCATLAYESHVSLLGIVKIVQSGTSEASQVM